MISLLPTRFLTPKRLLWTSIGVAITTITLKTLAWYVTDSVGATAFRGLAHAYAFNLVTRSRR